MIRIHSHLRWQIKGNGETRLAVGEKIFEPLVGFGGRPVTRVLTHCPQLAAIA